LIVVSLIKGISDLKDVTQLSSLGIRTFSLYILTTLITVTIGLGLVNLIQPGKFISQETRLEMLGTFGGDIEGKVVEAQLAKETRGPLAMLVDIVPENLIESAASNSNMLQIIFFSLLVGIAMISLPFGQIKVFKEIMDGANKIVLKIVDIIRLLAPYGVVALIATLIPQSPSPDVFEALRMYAVSVVLGLIMVTFPVYSFVVYFMGKMTPVNFFKAIPPAQLLP